MEDGIVEGGALFVNLTETETAITIDVSYNELMAVFNTTPVYFTSNEEINGYSVYSIFRLTELSSNPSASEHRYISTWACILSGDASTSISLSSEDPDTDMSGTVGGGGDEPIG